eukprot:gnl/TRDRNA2_/TRDRNA2_134540_c0_seq2.p1 gnl/TRDRNA2_/TRDRNA2_134540_c0~~gnl/TRDRNA2_/TRDRNA2_134540_c0_seq2.p1  ORF type:complete len:120 (-),score=8.80 gnl/TRDRNA2_/TRDRNA2_134540_c0_seq2:32-391(-)
MPLLVGVKRRAMLADPVLNCTQVHKLIRSCCVRLCDCAVLTFLPCRQGALVLVGDTCLVSMQLVAGAHHDLRQLHFETRPCDCASRFTQLVRTLVEGAHHHFGDPRPASNGVLHFKRLV